MRSDGPCRFRIKAWSRYTFVSTIHRTRTFYFPGLYAPCRFAVDLADLETCKIAFCVIEVDAKERTSTKQSHRSRGFVHQVGRAFSIVLSYLLFLLPHLVQLIFLTLIIDLLDAVVSIALSDTHAATYLFCTCIPRTTACDDHESL